MAEEEVVDFSKLSLEDRCNHKNWKARVHAYEEFIKIFPRIDDDKSPEWNKYISLVRKFPVDSNAAAQEKGLEATLLFLENSASAGRIVGEVVSAVLAKGLISPKQKSKELSADIVLMCIEIEKYELVQEEFLKIMESKNPKVVSATIALIVHALRDFGPKVFNLKLLMKKIPVLIEDRDKTIREETKKLIVEFYRWLGAGFKVHLATVKPVVMTELEAEFEKLGSEKPVQNRYLRSQQAKKEVQAQDAEDGEEQANVPAEDAAPDVDPYDLLDPVDILSKLPKELYPRSESPKWQERKEVLEELLVLASSPKLEAGDYSDVVRMLKRIISKDANVIVVGVAGKCLSGLANGLKKKFSAYAASCLTTILEKFKEKKINVLTAMREASDACYYATSLEAIQEDVLGALGNKNPQIKAETSLFLARSFSKTPNKFLIDKKLMKPYLTAVLANLNEPDPNVRDTAAEALGVAMKAMGEKAVQPYLQDLEAVKLQKVKDFAEKATVMAPKAAPAAAKSAPPKTAPAKAPSSSSVPPKASVQKKPVIKKPMATRKPPMSAPSQAQNDDELATSKKRGSGSPSTSRPTSPTPADDKGPKDISSLLTPELIEKLSDKSWKIREDHLDKISRMIVNKSIQPNLNDFPQALCQRLQDSNRNIAMNAVLLCGNLATALGPNAKHQLRSMLPSILACLCDNKTNVRSNVIACMNSWADAAGFDKFFQGECLYEAVKGNNPYLRLELFSWLATRLPEAKNINKEELNICVPNLLASLEDRSADVRKSAQDVLPAFMIQLGYDAMCRAASRLKPASKIAVQALLDKHRPAVAEKQSKPKSGALTYRVDKDKKSPTINGAGKSDALDTNKTKAVRPGTRPSPVSPGSKKFPEASARRPSQSPESRKTLDNDFDDQIDPREEEPYADQYYETPPSNHNAQEESRSVGLRGRVWNLPAKYQVDFEAIDNMFGPADLEPMPPLRLHDTNIDFLQNEVPVLLPTRRTQTRGNPGLGELYVPSRASQSIDLVVSQMGSADTQVCLEAIVQLDTLLSDLEVANVMSTRVDGMLSMICAQLRKSQALLQTSNPDKLEEINKLYRAIVQLIQTLYKGNVLPLRATRDYLRELVYHLLALIVDPNVSAISDSENILKHSNIMVCRIIEKSDPNEIFCALVRLLDESLQKHPSNKRLLELTYKCLWKWLKQFNMWADDKAFTIDVECFLREFFAFMKEHPFSSFANRDITPLKTMKTIIHGMVNKLGPEKIEIALVRIPDHKNTEAGLYMCKLVQKEMKNRSNADAQHHVNNNVDEFFANHRPPAETNETKNQTYMSRLKLIQDRIGQY